MAIDNSAGLAHGDVYVEDTQNHRIEQFTAAGQFVLAVGGGVNATPATTHPNVCLAGEKCQAGTPGPGASEFETLARNAIAVGPTGTLYVGDNGRVQKFSEGGASEGEILLAEAGTIEALAVDSTGDLYVQGFPRGVHEYDGAGTEIGTPRDATGGQLAIAVGSGDELFVSDPVAGHILEYDASGTQIGSIAETGPSQASGIAFDNTSKALYVLGVQPVVVHIVPVPPPGPVILESSQDASAVLPTSATLNATINPESSEVTHYHFEYGTTAAYGTSTPEPELAPGFEDQPVSAPVSGLQPRTLYHFRVVANNASGTTEGPDQTFETLPPVSIDATSASQVSATAATLETELNPHGVASTYYFEYDSVPYAEGEAPHTHGASSPEASAGSGVVDVPGSAQVQGLASSTVYYYRVVAHNNLGTVVGPDHSFTTQGATASVLPDGRQWELVSPANKQGSPLESITEEGGLIQAADGGGGIAYIAKGPIDAEPASNRAGGPTQQLLAKRGAAGWSTQDLATPHQAPAGFVAGNPSEYKLFSSDLSSAIVEPDGATPLSPQTSERTPYVREADGQYTPLVSAANVPAGTKFGGEEVEGRSELFQNGVNALSATPDLSHVLLSSEQLLAPGFASGFATNEKSNLYEWSAGALQLVSLVPSGSATVCGGTGPRCTAASEAGASSEVGRGGANVRNAISTGGSRVVLAVAFDGGSEPRLYVRDLGRDETIQLDAAEAGCGSCESGHGVFQLASTDDSRVFFTDQARLTSDATAKNGETDLYECVVVLRAEKLACDLKDLSVDPHAGEAANVQGAVLGSDEAGRYVYYVARGALVQGASSGTCPQASEGTCVNLYAYDTVEGTNRLVAVLSAADAPDWFGEGEGDLGEVTSRVSPNGRYLAFMSQRPLTGYDNRDAQSGARDEEVFEYDYATNELSCASCDPSGQRPLGVFDIGKFPGLLVDRTELWKGRWLAASVPGWTTVDRKHALYQSRYLSDSGRLFFNAADALVPQDTNGVEDVYQYERVGGAESEGQPASNSCTTGSATYSPRSAGCVNLISAGTSPEESAFMDASESGNDVFFLTASKLSSSDVDGALDLYDAHACSVESPCPPPPPPAPPACAGDACQNPVAAPNDATPGSLTFHGPGNLAPPAAVKPKAKPLTRAQKLTKALKGCKKTKGNGKQARAKRATCEKTARKSFGPVKKAKRRKAK